MSDKYLNEIKNIYNIKDEDIRDVVVKKMSFTYWKDKKTMTHQRDFVRVFVYSNGIRFWGKLFEVDK